ncbi:MAG: FtsX-like permease family protein, partial [Gemmatimonadetes bacterium]|nr:FtsX-like permease family protein [Gemmatimonadota bacterium]
TARAREFAVRVALGAERSRLLRQLLTESLLISLSAAVLGLGFAAALNRVLIWVSAGTEELYIMAELDGPVLAFTLLVSLVAPLAFGLFPALRASSTGPGAALGDGRSGDGGRAGKRVRSGLVTAQVSLALTLMILATLLTRSVINLSTRPLGFDGADILTFEVALPEAAYEEEQARLQFFTRAREAVSEISGVGAVELTSALPGVEPGRRRSVEIEGLEQPEGRAAPTVLMTTVSTGLFELLGLQIEGGRGFVETDNAESFPVAVVSHEIAGQFWPNESAVGRRFRVPGDEQWLQVVGVVGDMRAIGDFDRQARNVYVPQAQDARQSLYLVSRTGREPSSVAAAIREAIWSVDPQQPVDAIRTLERAKYERSAGNYAILTLFVVFAVFALLMAAIGIYGVMAYSVSQRTEEIGLRMALGAEVATVRWMVVSQGARLVGAGIALGLVASFVLSRLLGNIVFGITTTDRLTFIGMPVLLALVALMANLIPARRATKLDPASTLRGD